MPLPPAFLALSARIGADPLLVQGPGGNTSAKIDGTLWIKASGTELADAESKEIFVAVDPEKALAALDGEGDPACRDALRDPECGLRPSIETTFHALLPHRYVFHYHSVAAIRYLIAPQGRHLLDGRLAGLDWLRVPYRQPGIPLSHAIRDTMGDKRPDIVLLDNHGVIVGGDSIEKVSALIDEVELRLRLPKLIDMAGETSAPEGWRAVAGAAALALDPGCFARATAGSYYPDHVVFLGPGLPQSPDEDGRFPAWIAKGDGVFIRADATPAQGVMVQCLADVLTHIPADWTLDPIGPDAEAALLNWDAEKYRQALAARGAA